MAQSSQLLYSWATQSNTRDSLFASKQAATSTDRFATLKPTPTPFEHHSTSSGSLWIIPVVVCLVALLAVIAGLFWMWKKGKLGKLNPFQNAYVRKMKREAQMERVAKVEEERRAGGAAIDRGYEMAPMNADQINVDPKVVTVTQGAKV